MQSQNRHFRRVHRESIARVVAAAFALAALASCGDDSAKNAGPRVNLPSRSPPRQAGVADGADAASGEAAALDVGGRVVDDLEQPIVGRTLVVVDSRGKRFEVMTDEEGGFHVSGVASPYDLLVRRAPSGSVITPVVFFGLKRADPRLEVFERNGPTERPASQSLRIGVKLPSCPAVSGACWVSVVSASTSGVGGTAGSYTEGAQTALYEVTHSFHAAQPKGGETLDVHVLVGDAQYTHYAYARLVNIAVRPGEPMDLGMVSPLPIEASMPVTIAARTAASPGEWQWTLASDLELSGGATIPLRYEWSATTAMRLPRLPGATWNVAVWAQRPPAEERAYFHRTTQAWSGALPLTATTVAIDLPSAPEPVRPALEGALSRRALGLAWTMVSPGLATVALIDLARGQRFRAFTSETEVPLRRLAALGLAPLEPGEHVFDLTTTPGATVDELTHPDDLHRRARFDRHVPGASTYQRFRFQVTP